MIDRGGTKTMEGKKEYQQKRKDEFAKKFIENNEIPRYLSYSPVSKFRSIKRAIRRGHIDLYTGLPFPRRPFSNRKPTPGRRLNELKKNIYGQYSRAI